jgi:flagellar protein FlbD
MSAARGAAHLLRQRRLHRLEDLLAFLFQRNPYPACFHARAPELLIGHGEESLIPRSELMLSPQLPICLQEPTMIRVTRLNQAPMILNSDLIEHIEMTPDTVIALTNGQIVRVRETADEVLTRIIDFRRAIQGHVALQPELTPELTKAL